MITKLKRTPGIYIVGFMGSGKSTVGRSLAHRLGWSFFDIDSEIEQVEKTSISEIFASLGEPAFRRMETEMIRRHVGWIERGRPAVVALGGGAFANPANRDLLENNRVTVWLDCPF
jgi:shikimate kinase